MKDAFVACRATNRAFISALAMKASFMANPVGPAVAWSTCPHSLGA